LTLDFLPYFYRVSVRNIIFDLGGVIINLDTKRTINAFNQLSEVPFEELYSGTAQDELFSRFDKGLLKGESFFRELKKRIRHSGPDEELLTAWNAMLLDIPPRRLEMLIRVKQRYRSYLLSNTCGPHISEIEKYLYAEHGVRQFADYFDKVYYSCRVGMRKPDKQIFEMVLHENGLLPEETVFIDDTIQHVKAAGECGIRAYLLAQGTEAETLLKELNLL
jgi:epoxide hydrolase-like predicted phosphatase